MVVRRLSCGGCALNDTCSGPVQGSGRWKAPIMLIGEAPGRQEDEKGKPFVGLSGMELDNYLERAGLRRSDCYITNVVKCRPPSDRDPKPDEIAACLPLLLEELEQSKASIVGLVGAVAGRTLLGDEFNLDMMHGIPLANDSMPGGCLRFPLVPQPIVVPLYHPAYGIHETTRMSRIMSDFEALGKVHREEIKPREVCNAECSSWPANWPIPDIGGVLKKGRLTAVDTETTSEGEPWCLSISQEAGTGFVVMANDEEVLKKVNKMLRSVKTLTILHNALFDLPVLAKMGVYPKRYVDTMVMAYLLQSEPQALKTLAYRLLDMQMTSYKEMVAPYMRTRAVAYLQKIMKMRWPTPTPLVQWNADGEPRIKQPQSVHVRVKRMLDAAAKDPQLDLHARWKRSDKTVKEIVEMTIGKMPEADLRDAPLADAMSYSARDADVTLRIYPILLKMIKEKKLEDTLALDMGIVHMIADMQSSGMLVDPDKLGELSASHATEMDAIQQAVDGLAGKCVNLGSTKQVGKLLFTTLKLKPGHKTKSGADSTDVKALTHIKDKHPIVPLLLRWRTLQTNKTTFVDPLRLKRSKDGRIHPNIRTTRTTTGRLSCSDPNFQNIPIRSEEGRQVRRCFMARPGCSLLSADYSQIEMRVVAHVAEDTNMIKVFTSGRDLHRQTASMMFGISPDMVEEKEHRYPAKRIGFGTLYGLTPEGLLEELVLAGCEGWTVNSCAEMIREWFRMYPGVAQYFYETRAYAKEHGYVRNLFGRIRLIPEAYSVLRWVREAGERQACATVVQGGAQDIIKMAMRDLIPIYQAYRKSGSVCDPLIQIHDDLLWEVGDDILPSFAAMLEATMVNVVTLSMPLEVDLKFGRNWGDMDSIR